MLLFVPLGSLHIAIDAADYQICYDVSGALLVWIVLQEKEEEKRCELSLKWDNI